MLISAKTVKKNKVKYEEYKTYLSNKYVEEFNEVIENSKIGIDNYIKIYLEVKETVLYKTRT